MATSKKLQGRKILDEMFGQNPDWANLMSGLGGPMAGATFEAKAYPKVIQALKQLGKITQEDTLPPNIERGYGQLRRWLGIMGRETGSASPSVEDLQGVYHRPVGHLYDMKVGELKADPHEYFKGKGEGAMAHPGLQLPHDEITDHLLNIAKYIKALKK